MTPTVRGATGTTRFVHQSEDALSNVSIEPIKFAWKAALFPVIHAVKICKSISLVVG